MNRVIFCMLYLFVAGGFNLYAQKEPKITVEGLEFVFIDDEQIKVSFTAKTSKKASANGYTYIYAPRITNQEMVVSLTPIVVQSRRANVSWKRHEWVADTLIDMHGAYTMANNDALAYVSTVPLQPWMFNSSIEVQEITAGYDVQSSNLFMLAERAIPYYEPDPVEKIGHRPVRNPLMCIGDSLAYKYSYLYPDSVFCVDSLPTVYRNERTDYPAVYFTNGSYTISPECRDNEQVLDEYLTVLKTIENSADTQISKIVVAGFSSPLGSYSSNDLLAWRRALSLKRFVVERVDIPVDSVCILNGSADWIGLRETIMADDSIPNEARAERIVKKEIKNARALEKRVRQLRRTRGGKPYKHLLQTQGFENLNRAYMRVYYKSESK